VPTAAAGFGGAAMPQPGTNADRRALAVASLAAVAILSAPMLRAQGREDLVEETTFALQEALDRGKYDLAVGFGRRLVELEPKQVMPPYLLARAYAGAGNADAAVEWLGTSAELGFLYPSTLQRDAEFDAVREHSGFADAAAHIRKNSREALERFKLKAERATVLTIVPPDIEPTEPAPLIVALHGYGTIAANIAKPLRDIAAEARAILIAPQAVDRVGRGFSWGVIEQAEYLILRAIEKTRDEHNVDEQRVVITGFSQGGHMSFLMGLRYPDRFAGVIPICGFYEHRLTPVPETPTPGLPRFFIMNGANDAAADNNRDAARRLKAIGAPVELRLYDGVGHSLPQNPEPELRAALRYVFGD
jgi:predicted esterase